MRARLTSRLGILLAALLLALAGGLACNTPSVPLPPPALSALSFEQSDSSTVIMKGQAESLHANARFYIYNLSKGEGVITDAAADGSFTSAPFAGGSGDTVEIYYDAPGGGERSPAVCTTLQFGAALIGADCL